jgi:vesicle coat complex subunit
VIYFYLFPATALTDLDTPTINKLLTALNECTEWGQVFILDSLATYSPTDAQEAQNICERVTPRLSHANAAVVLSAVKVLMKFMEALPSDADYLDQVTKKLAPPLGKQCSCHFTLHSCVCGAVFLFVFLPSIFC